ncbi:unnamed protein product [Adineta steineri]|uniref:Uncharacterized protein n=1 Tax=Adineta steineri TaxID=433720 RepID=A0A815ZWC0_9BILA|nr:unnamed protein product [Adineta steineri]CAF1587389.1 unnamed protein product [Adineta steineri]
MLNVIINDHVYDLLRAKYFIFFIVGFTTPALPNHPGRAALISGPKRQVTKQNNSTTNRSITSRSTSVSSPAFGNIEHIRSYSVSHIHSDQVSHTSSGSSTPTSSRRTSISDKHEKPRRSSAQIVRGPKSLREWHEQPASLLEQPSLLEKVNIQILSPNSDRTHRPFFYENNPVREKSKSEENLIIENETNSPTTTISDATENK